MNAETKTCVNCKNQFVIEPEDFDFYKKMAVPPPTFCPDCRLQRRLAYRNERGLSKRKCNAPGHSEDIISAYSDPKLVVYDERYWWSDAWDAGQYGRAYDFTKPFFLQFRELMEQTPHIALVDSKSTNTSYCNYTVEHKNCYLVSAGWNNEDCYYGNRISFCKDTLDSYVCHRTEFSYENVYCKESYQLFWSRNSENCNNSYFLYDCRGCSHCACCVGLRNKQYYIFNQPYTKEEYVKKIAEINLGNRASLSRLQEKLESMRLATIHRYAQVYKSQNVIGDNIEEAKNCYWCFDVAGNAENSKYCNWATYGMKDCYDSGPGAGGQSELTYEGVSIGVNNARCAFGAAIWYSHDILYSYNCHSSQYLFGCVSLRNKKYCILNKQYSKEEYEALLPRIRKHMENMPYVDKNGRQYRYGELFPIELSPFAYNETVAQEFFPLTEKESAEENYPWRTEGARSYAPTMRAADLPDSIQSVSDDISKEIIECEHANACNDGCASAFKIIPQELMFYRKFNLPLPRLCFNCRHANRLRQRNPTKLWHRMCACAGKASENGRYANSAPHGHHGVNHCQNEFETTYTPDRPEIVYCEQCYQAEIV